MTLKINFKKQGYTLLEILITILLISLISALAINSYREFIKDTFSESVGIRREMDLKSLIIYLRKMIGSTGFGVPLVDPKVWDAASCNNFNTFINSTISAVVGVARNCTEGNEELYLKSAYVSETRFSGCWWVNNQTQSLDKRLEECNFNLAENGTCIALGLKKELLGIDICKNLVNTPGLIVYLHNTDTNAYPRRTALRLYLNNTTTSECAPGSYSLYRETYNSIQPLFDCLGGMRFDHSFFPSGLRICLLVQVSGRSSIGIDPPQNSNCGSFNIKPEWKYYRWRVIEEVIPFKNL